MFKVIFNGMVDEDIGIKAVKRPSIPAPVRKYREIAIEGRNGKLYEDLGTYDDIEIAVQYNFISQDYHGTMRLVKNWISKIKDNKLKFSDDLDYFLRVNKASIDTPERIWKIAGRFIVKFNCKPFHFLESGTITIPLTSDMKLFNDGEVAYPMYKIKGEGMCDLVVNNKSVRVNVGQEIFIDTERQLCLKSDGSTLNSSLQGSYEDLYLQEGNNILSVSNGFTAEITPFWRCL